MSISLHSKHKLVRKAALWAFAIAGTVSALGAQAAIVDSGPVSIAIPDTFDGVYFNILTGATGSSGAGTPGWDINPYGSTLRQFFWPSAPANSSGGVSDGTAYTVLTNGATVGPASTFIVAATGAAAANFNTGTPGTKIIGLRFNAEPGNTLHYGYIELTSPNASGLGATITRYVFESTPNTPITVAPPGPPAVAPQFSYTPAAGSTVTGTGGAGVGTTANLTITPAIGTAGSGTGTTATTTLTCTAPTAPFAGFGQTVTAIGNGAISGGPLSGSCTLGAAAVTQTLTCVENQGGTAVTRTWTLSCPAGAVAQPVDALGNLAKLLMLLAVLGVGLVAVRRH
jgi:hypothetical protein